MRFIYNDGGRLAAGYKGRTGDCFVRAFAIASGLPYQTIYDMVKLAGALEHDSSKRRGKKSSPTAGIWKRSAHRIGDRMALWTPVMGIGTGCRVHLRDGELPMGRLVVSLSRHYAAVIDGVIFDLYDPSRGGTRCVYGYWRFVR